MRFVLLLSVLLLVACGSSSGEAPKPAPATDLNAAAAHCLSKGYVRGSFDYNTCYRNTPQVQAHERTGRLESLAIINKNKSGSGQTGRSYPVE